MSYDGKLDFGLIGDYDAIPDLDALAADLEASLAELVETAAPAKPKRRKTTSKRKPKTPAGN
jgi:hypothetical protein